MTRGKVMLRLEPGLRLTIDEWSAIGAKIWPLDFVRLAFNKGDGTAILVLLTVSRGHETAEGVARAARAICEAAGLTLIGTPIRTQLR